MAFAVDLPKPTFLRKGYFFEKAARGDNSPGASWYTAWVLWDVDMTPVLRVLPKDKRADARAALWSAEPQAAPAWATVKKEPAWADKFDPLDGHLSIVLRFDSHRADVAKANTMVLAPGRLGSAVAHRLRKLLGGEGAWKVGRTAATWRMLRARAVQPPKSGLLTRVGLKSAGKATTWILWDVPIAPLLEAVPAEKRKAAKPLLLQP